MFNLLLQFTKLFYLKVLTDFFNLAIIFFNNQRQSSCFVKRSEIWWLVRTSQAKLDKLHRD